MSATGKYPQFRVEQAYLPDDFIGIFDICTQDQTPCRLDARVFKRSRPQDIAIDGRESLRSDTANGIEVQIDDRNCGPPIFEQPAHDPADRTISDQDAAPWINIPAPSRGDWSRFGRGRRYPSGPRVDEWIEHYGNDRGSDNSIPAGVVDQIELASHRAENKAEFADLRECGSDWHRRRERDAKKPDRKCSCERFDDNHHG